MGALVIPVVSLAQQKRTVPWIGFLVSETISGAASQIDALQAGLSDYGYIEGRNIAIAIRSASSDYARLSDAAEELARLKVNVIVVVGTKAASAATRATTTIPIIDPLIGDPVAGGLGGTLARPAGNVTGSVQLSPEAAARRLALLKEAVPGLKRIAVLFNPSNEGSTLQLQAMHATANALKLELQRLEVRAAKDLGATFAAIEQGRVDAIVLSTDALFQVSAIDISDLAAKQRLPSVGATAYAVVGGLLGYGVHDAEMYRHAAYFVDRILKGAKPRDVPIERATKLELVINLETAKVLGITIPQSLLARADAVIQW
jgi:putative ABC transport system substrate-binding protein